MITHGAECELPIEAVAAYVDYVFTGREIDDRAGTEEHLTACGVCARAYAELLQVKIVDEVEQILDLTLGMNARSADVRVRRVVGEHGTEIDVLLDLALHWLDVSRDGLAPDEQGCASALFCIGAIQEIKGNPIGALAYYDEAAELAGRVDNAYARVRSLSGRGRVMAAAGRKREALVSLRAACVGGRALRDWFGVVRDYVAMGDVLRASKGIPGRLEALRCYVLASRTAAEAGYESGKAVAAARLKDYREAVAAFFGDLMGSFVGVHAKKEAPLLDDFCKAFVAGLGNILGSGTRLAYQPVSSRLGFSAAVGDIKTIALLSTVAKTIEELAGRTLASNIGVAEEVGQYGDIMVEDAELRRAVSRSISYTAAEQGLSRKDAVKLSEYLTERITSRPELLEDLEFAGGWA